MKKLLTTILVLSVIGCNSPTEPKKAKMCVTTNSTTSVGGLVLTLTPSGKVDTSYIAYAQKWNETVPCK